jgi:hypothetical protein
MVSIDTVYQRVLVIANKEQRGYITPQEFNLYANQAQMDIFEQYFYDLNQFARMPSVGIEYSDVDEKIDEKLSVFKAVEEVGQSGTTVIGALNSGQFPFPVDALDNEIVYKLGTMWNHDSGTEIHKVDHREIAYIGNSPLAAPTRFRPVYVLDENQISVFPNTVTTVTFRYIRIPLIPRWTYTVVNEQAQYNASALDLQDFELHPSEEVDLVVKILEFAGVTMKDPNLYQIAAQEEMRNVQQEKQ